MAEYREPCPVLNSGPQVSRNVDMIWIPGGVFNMGSDKHYAEEAPVHPVTVDGFWIDRTPVTNRDFRQLRQGDRLCHLCGDRARPEGLSRALCPTC